MKLPACVARFVQQTVLHAEYDDDDHSLADLVFPTRSRKKARNKIVTEKTL